MTRAAIMIAGLAAALLLVAGQAAAEPMDAFGERDIGASMDVARQAWDVSSLDAVVLLDETVVSIHQDGSRTDMIHRIVWMATELALEEYGDLRVPWNSDTSDLKVLALRTWRGGRWWPDETGISETAVVQTIPYAVTNADDYTSMRETMLLHDGIELPCIVETAYEITRRPWRAAGGLDGEPSSPGHGGEYGMWTFAKADPCVVSSLVITVPPEIDVQFDAANGAPEPSTTRSPSDGVRFAWEMRGLDRVPHPIVADPASEVPNVVWTTWTSWEDLGAAVSARFEDAASLTQSLRDSVASLVEREAVPWARAEAVAGFIAETTRLTNYPCSYWEFAPRPAARTWETAYGHRLDRAVLAAALLREAGCPAGPAYVSDGKAEDLPLGVPALARFGGVSLRVDVGGLEAIYDPTSSSLTAASEVLRDRAIWAPGREPLAYPSSGAPGVMEVAISLGPTENGWSGSATLRAEGALSPQAAMLGVNDEAESFLGSLLSSILEGASVSGWGPVEFSPDRVVCAFSVDVAAGEPDGSGRTRLRVNPPDAGIMGALPNDVHLYVGHRDSPVVLPAALSQTVTLRLDPGDSKLVETPSPSSLTNAVGGFDLTVKRNGDGSVTLSRTLRLDHSRVEAGEWPDLRALLLAETNERSGTLLLR